VGLFGWLFGGKKGKGKGGVKAPRRKKAKVIDVPKRFDMRRRSGQGSMSKVWQAYDKELGRTVCVKLLDKQKTAQFEGRFTGLGKPNEGEICIALRHKNIVQTFDVGVSKQGEPVLVMEWIEGVGLNFLIETKAPQLEKHNFSYMIQLSEALAYIHQQRYLHRDLCPRNVMITKEGVVKLIDFGLTIPYKPEFCRPGNRTGTADYLAPELIRRQPTDHRVDMFALGATAFEVFTGGLPWERAASSEETLRRHMHNDARDPRAVRPGLPEGLYRLLQRSVSRDREQRFQTALEFRDALRALAPKEQVREAQGSEVGSDFDGE
jgi:serine/threonine protein kinase